MARDKETAEKAIGKAAKDWRAAKKREREARDSFAALVQQAVTSGLLTENRIAQLTEIPRMTIRKMLGKS